MIKEKIEMLIQKYEQEWTENGMGSGISYSRLIAQLKDAINGKTLNMVFKRRYYEMRGERGKMFELRRPTKWILSRLINPDGSKKTHSFVELCDGYSSNSAKKYRLFLDFVILDKEEQFDLPNGEILNAQPGDILILLEGKTP